MTSHIERITKTYPLTAEDVLAYIRQHDPVSFAEMARRFEGFRGEFLLESGSCPNIVFWTGISQEAASILRDLKRSGQIEYAHCEPIVYYIDGEVPRLPVAVRPPSKRGFKHPHWLPLTIRPVRNIDAPQAY